MNTFEQDVYSPGTPTTNGIHHHILESLSELASELAQMPAAEFSGPGEVVTLSSPRAGYGKSHLLARLADEVEDRAAVIPLSFAPEQMLSWRELTIATCEHLAEHATPEGDITLLDETARYLFAQVVRDGMDSGAVAANNQDTSRSRLQTHFREIFHPSGQDSRVSWFRQWRQPLFDRVGGITARRFGARGPALDFWGQGLLPYTCRPAKASDHRAETLLRYLDGHDADDAQWRQRFRLLIRCASEIRPLVFVADQLDAFFDSPRGSSGLARRLVEISEEVPRSLTIVSVNQDFWDPALGLLPSALKDRLTWQCFELQPLTMEQAEALVIERMSQSQHSDDEIRNFLALLDLDGAGQRDRATVLTPRTLIRRARQLWRCRGLKPDQAAGECDKTIPFAPLSEGDAIPSPEAIDNRSRLHAVADSIQVNEAKTLADGKRVVRELVRKPTPGAAVPSLSEQFQGLRVEHLSGELAFNPERLFRLVSAVGKRFPTIGQSGVEMDPQYKGKALAWQTHDRLIYLGFAPPTSYQFWRELMVKLESAEGPDGKTERFRKLAVMCPAGEHLSLDRVMASGENGSPADSLIDQVELDSELTASLYAADDLIEGNKTGRIACRESHLYGFLAHELDFFWRRVTRHPRPAQPTEASDEEAGHALQNA